MDEQMKELLTQIATLKDEMRSAGEAQAVELRKQIDTLADKVGEIEKRAIEANRPGNLEGASNTADTEYRNKFVGYLRTGDMSEIRGLGGADNDTGGALVPLDIDKEILRMAHDENELRAKVTNRKTSRDRVFLGALDRPITGWGNVNPTGQQLATANGKYFDVHNLKALVVVQESTLEDADADIAQILVEEFSKAVAEEESKAWSVGTGVNEPAGFCKNPTVMAAALKTGVAAKLPATDEATAVLLRTALFSMKKVYRKNAVLICNSLTEAALRAIKGEDGKYLVQNDKLFGTVPFVTVEDMDDIGAGTFPIAFADLRAYQVYDRKGLRVKRITGGEYDANSQVGFLVHVRQAGGLAQTDAVRLIKCSV